MGHGFPLFDFRGSPDDHILCGKDSAQSATVARGSPIARQCGILNDEKIQITVRSRIPSGPRPEKHNFVGGADRQNAVNHLSQQQVRHRGICKNRRHIPNSRRGRTPSQTRRLASSSVGLRVRCGASPASAVGAPNPKTGDAYLVPYDGDPVFVDKTAYSLKRLYEQLGNLPAEEVVVVLDSCFSGAGGRSVIAQGVRPLVLSMENPILAKGRTMVLSASAGEQISSTYETKGHGLLTYFFLKGLQGDADANKDGTIEVSELFDYLKPQVERTARREFNNEQTPQLLGSPEILKRGVRLVELR